MANSNSALTDARETPVSPRRQRRQRQCLKAVCFFMLIGLGLSVAISVLVMRALLPVTVTFDMADTINQYQQQMALQFNAENPLSEQQIAQATQRFQMALSDSLSEYQVQHHALILVTPAVVMGAEDITVEIQAAIANKMAQ
ncbi:TPA: type-F conjugative transfer system protein TrbI [Providencia alcalifaciens]